MNLCAISLPGYSSPKKCPVQAESGFFFNYFCRFCQVLYFFADGIILQLQLLSAIAYVMFGLIVLREDANV